MQEKNKEPSQNVVRAPKKTVKKKKMAKKKKRTSLGAVFSIILLLVIVGVAAVLYFDVAGSKQILAQVLELEKPTQEQLDEVAAAQLELEQNQEELNSSMLANDQKSKELEQKESELNAWQGKLDSQEEDFAAEKAEWEAQITDVDNSIEMFELMEAETAAKAIGQMKDDEAIIRLLTAMSSEKAADILNYLDFKVTADVLNIIMQDDTEEPAN